MKSVKNDYVTNVNEKIARSVSLLNKCSYFILRECLCAIYFTFVHPNTWH